MGEPIRILVADDHAIVREGLRVLIETQSDMRLVGEAADGDQTIAQARALRPDVILLDLLMPRKEGLAAIPDLLRNDPRVRILILTSFAESSQIFPALRAGACGYLLKDASPMQLLQAIRDAFQGKSPLDATVAREIVQELRQERAQPLEEYLTEAEMRVLKMLAQGASNQAIAEQLVVSERTVRTHVEHILEKLQLSNRTQAAIYALRQGLADA